MKLLVCHFYAFSSYSRHFYRFFPSIFLFAINSGMRVCWRCTIRLNTLSDVIVSFVNWKLFAFAFGFRYSISSLYLSLSLDSKTSIFVVVIFYSVQNKDVLASNWCWYKWFSVCINLHFQWDIGEKRIRVAFPLLLYAFDCDFVLKLLELLFHRVGLSIVLCNNVVVYWILSLSYFRALDIQHFPKCYKCLIVYLRVKLF